MGLPRMVVWSWSICCIILSRKRLNNSGESKQPCLTPSVVLKKFPTWLFKITALVAWSYRACMTSISPLSTLRPFWTCHKPNSVEGLFEIDKAVKLVVLILKVVFHENSVVKNLFFCAPPGSEICLLLSI